MFLGNSAGVAADLLEVGRSRHLVVVVTGVEHLGEGAPLSLVSVVEGVAADKRYEFAQHRGFGVDVGDGARLAVVSAPGGDDLLGKAFRCRSVAAARRTSAAMSGGVQVVFGFQQQSAERVGGLSGIDAGAGVREGELIADQAAVVVVALC